MTQNNSTTDTDIEANQYYYLYSASTGTIRNPSDWGVKIPSSGRVKLHDTNTITTNQNSGTQTSNTQTIGNLPKTLENYIWRRTA
jgi:hypothetical protein